MLDAALDKVLTLLAPLFLEAAKADVQAARNAARTMLDSYEPRTPREIRLAALAIAFGFGALDALSKAIDPDLTLSQTIRLRSNATALHRSAEQAEKRLDAMRKAPPDETAAPKVPLPDSTETEELVAFIKTEMKSMPPLNRQQRRAAERMVEKARRRQEVAQRQAARAAALAAA